MKTITCKFTWPDGAALAASMTTERATQTGQVRWEWIKSTGAGHRLAELIDDSDGHSFVALMRGYAKLAGAELEVAETGTWELWEGP